MTAHTANMSLAADTEHEPTWAVVSITSGRGASSALLHATMSDVPYDCIASIDKCEDKRQEW